ncbi:unnamed protein product [Blepharisma stoltei]|uniref:Uncharacterized protein n=1 Tax=Blepharisma stoltei TaxID=1481888 RepID=A0AAU9IUC8_9CILI|nr:unnamed protein product [Blepharisma stoltei]
MRALFLAFLIGAVLDFNSGFSARRVRAESTSPNDLEVHQIISGLLEGLPTEAQYPEIKDCISGTDKISENFSLAISSYKLSTAESATQTLKYLAAALNQFPRFLDCNPVERDLSRVYHSLNVFQNPLTFSFAENKSLKVNEREIHWYLDQAMKFFEAKRWKDFGFYLGTCLGKVGGSGIQVIGY